MEGQWEQNKTCRERGVEMRRPSLISTINRNRCLCMFVISESVPRAGEDLHVQVNKAGERKDSMVKINQEVNTIPSPGPKVLKTV